jgi:hypothetical protein
MQGGEEYRGKKSAWRKYFQNCPTPKTEDKEKEGGREKLTQSKEDISCEDSIKPGPEEAGLEAPVPLVRAELAIADDVDEGDVDGVVCVAREDDALSAQTRRWDLGHDRVHYGTDGEVGRRAQQENQRPRCPRLGRAGVRVDSQEADYAIIIKGSEIS